VLFVALRPLTVASQLLLGHLPEVGRDDGWDRDGDPVRPRASDTAAAIAWPDILHAGCQAGTARIAALGPVVSLFLKNFKRTPPVASCGVLN